MIRRLMLIAMALVLALGTVTAMAEGAAEETQEPYKTGDIVTFGTYEQDNNPDNGAEPIEWIVLDIVNQKDSMSKKVDHRVLLISVYALDVQPYHAEHDTVTWKDCSLRKWLNEEFYGTAFTEDEQKLIAQASADNSDDQGNDEWEPITTSGNTVTKDNVFLLSYREVYKKPKDDKKKEKDILYFPEKKAAACTLTDYAIAKGAMTNDSKAAAWWLRSPGKNQFSAAGVYFDGSVFSGNVTSGYLAVRPAIWMKVEDAAQ